MLDWIQSVDAMSLPPWLGALWLGIQTSISPCPLATNIAAVSFIGRKVAHPLYVLATGLLYTLGRMAAYLLVGWLVAQGLLSPLAKHWIEQNLSFYMGPFLLLVGLILLGLVRFSFGGGAVTKHAHAIAERLGLAGAFVLGFLFALAFCPVSAALFFMMLFSLAIPNESAFSLPLVYGLGTALPVVLFAVFIAVSTDLVGKAFHVVTLCEKYARLVTAIIFLVVGVWMTARFTLGLF